MSSKDCRLDIIVLGASGFTGRHVVKNLFSINKESEYSELTWGIAGRSKEKLECLLLELRNQGVKDVPIFECDVTDLASVNDVCSQATVIINATGPYTTLGEPVISTCIQTKTHYVDISAELHHMITTYRTYHKAAQDANVLIITACGYGSLPGTMGFVHLQKHFHGDLQSVECYTEIDIPKRIYSFRSLVCGGDNCLVHYGTWDSLVHELGNFPDFFRLQKETFPELIYDAEPEELKRGFLHRKCGKTWFPYPGPDSNIIDWTQRYLHEKKVQKAVNFKMYTTMPLLIHVIFIIPIMYCYYWLSTFEWFRKLLRKYPRFFTAGFMSHEGPRDETMDDTKYSFILTVKCSIYDIQGSFPPCGIDVERCIWVTRQGWHFTTVEFRTSERKPNRIFCVKPSGETVSGINPYKGTAMAFVFSAVTVLRDYSLMPKGGVLTTGAAFYNTQLVDKLNSHRLHFEFV